MSSTATTIDWVSGDSADFSTAADWVGGVVPVAGDIAVVTAGSGQISKVKIAANEIIPDITFQMGASEANTEASPTDDIAITDDSVDLTIDDTETGGTLTSPTSGPIMGAGIGVNGVVTFSGTINVGAGDGLGVGIASDTGGTTGELINDGVIDLTGTISATSFNFAGMTIKQGNSGGNAYAGAYTNYGTINLSAAVLYAEAPDESPTGASAGSGDITLSDYSTLAVFNALSNTLFNYTTVTFADGTDTLAVGQNDAGDYDDYGVIQGWRPGDTLDLEENGVTPASLSFNASTGVLSVLNASDVVIGQFTFTGGDYTSADFYGTQQSTALLADFWLQRPIPDHLRRDRACRHMGERSVRRFQHRLGLDRRVRASVRRDRDAGERIDFDRAPRSGPGRSDAGDWRQRREHRSGAILHLDH